jgi:glutaredoxin
LKSCTLTRVKTTLAGAAVIYAAGLFDLWHQGGVALAVWIVFLPACIWAGPYLRLIFTVWWNRNRPEERIPATRAVAAPATKVTVYTGLGCPYCLLVLRRLERLQAAVAFELNIVDLTLHAQLAAEKSIASVPVVEARGERIVGNASVEQLLRLISGVPAEAMASLTR